jgi:hypothetical protein
VHLALTLAGRHVRVGSVRESYRPKPVMGKPFNGYFAAFSRIFADSV